MPQATRTQVVKPLSGEQGVQDELASLLKDDDAEQEDKEKTGNSIVAEDEAATPTTSGPSLTPPGGAAEVIPKSPVGLRSKSLKFPRSALLGLWGTNQMQNVAKPRWRYLYAGIPVPQEPHLILKVRDDLNYQVGPRQMIPL